MDLSSLRSKFVDLIHENHPGVEVDSCPGKTDEWFCLRLPNGIEVWLCDTELLLSMAPPAKAPIDQRWLEFFRTRLLDARSTGQPHPVAASA